MAHRREAQREASGAAAQVEHSAGRAGLVDERHEEVVVAAPAELGVVDGDQPRVLELGVPHDATGASSGGGPGDRAVATAAGPSAASRPAKTHVSGSSKKDA